MMTTLAPRLSARRGRFLVVSIAVAFAAAAPACLPDVEFGAAMGDGGLPEGNADGPSGDAHADATTDTGPGVDSGDAAVDVVTDGATEADADPNALGPFVADLEEHDGFEGTCAVKSGHLYCWGGNGSNLSGQLGFPPDQQAGPAYPVPMQVTSTAAAVSTMTAITMGSNHACALYGRTAYCRGDNTYNQLGNSGGASAATETAVQGVPSGGLDLIAAAQISTCGVTLSPATGSVSNVYCWGENEDGELARPIDISPTIAGPVSGDIDGGPLGAISDAIAIAGGGYHFCAISQSRGILCWGSTVYMESGPAVGMSDCDGPFAGKCTDQPTPVPLPAGEVATGVAAGAFHSCAVTQSGHVYCWGWNLFNALGTSATLSQTCTDGADTTGCTGTPLQVAGLPTITAVRAGGSTTCAIDTSHNAWCWGDDSIGQIGDGHTNGSVSAPITVFDTATLSNFTFDEVSVGYNAACGRDGDSLICWGGGILGTSPADASVTPPTLPSTVMF